MEKSKPLLLHLDDNKDVLRSYAGRLTEFEIEFATSPEEAVQKIQAANGEIEVALVDMWLNKDEDRQGGLRAIRLIKQLEVAPPIIVLTAHGEDRQNIIDSMEAGAFSYVDKDAGDESIDSVELLRVSIRRALEFKNERQMIGGFIRVLAAVVDSHEPYTADHSVKVAECSGIIAREYFKVYKEDNSDEICTNIVRAGYVHDLGKVGIERTMLTRAGRFTDMEMVMIKFHPVAGARVLEKFPGLAHLVPAVLEHHEKWNGKGYPDGKKEEGISIEGRIMAVADTFDAMVSRRPYQESLLLDEAYIAISDEAPPDSHMVDQQVEKAKKRRWPDQFDPRVVRAFMQAWKDIRSYYEARGEGVGHA